MDNNGGNKISVKEGDFEGVHFGDDKRTPYEPFSTGTRMRRGKNPVVFDNNNNEEKITLLPQNDENLFGRI
jgi:hypothetical protein